MDKDVDGLPWLAMLAGICGNADTGGRAFMELVAIRASDEALYSAAASMNELARYKTPFSFEKQLALLDGEGWHPGDVAHVFDKATHQTEFIEHIVAERTRMHPANKLPSPAEMVFDEGARLGWQTWYEGARKRYPPCPARLANLVAEGLILRLRLDLCTRVHATILDMRNLAKTANEGPYLTRRQLPYDELIELMIQCVLEFMDFVEGRAEALLRDGELPRLGQE